MLESKRILLPANRLVEIDRMLRFAAELKQTTILYGGREAYRAAELLKKAGAPLLVSLRWPENDRDVDPDNEESLRMLESRDKAPSAPGVLAKAGVKFAFYSGGIEQPADLQRAVKKAIDAGLIARRRGARHDAFPPRSTESPIASAASRRVRSRTSS